MNKLLKILFPFIKFIIGFIFLLFWFPVLVVGHSPYEWINNISDIARLIAGVVGAYTIFIWIVNKSGLSNDNE